MAMLERVRPTPNWYGALEVALTRPEGVPERRGDEDPWTPPVADRPRRVSDDLAWFRQAMEDPVGHGLRPLDEEHELPVWEAADDSENDARLVRLHRRGVLEAAGFVLHEPATG